MSQPDHQVINIWNQPVGGGNGPPHPPPDEGSQFYDSSGPLFSLYSEIAVEEDNKLAERWQQDATDGILVFSGVFSAAVAALLTVSIQDIKPNSQDTSAFYLANIYQIFANPNSTVPRPSIPSNIATPPPFSPPAYAVWVNSLWFLSLVISLSCALLAISLRQWAGRYIRLTRPARCRPEKRARTRAFFSRGVKNMHVPWVVESMPALLHLSLLLFFAGLVIFLFNVNHSTFISVITCIVLFSCLYGWITLSPIFLPDSPYYGPLSSAVWSTYASLRNALSHVHSFIARLGSGDLQDLSPLAWPYGYRMSSGVWKAADEVATKSLLETDLSILQWTMDALGEDDRLERFFEAIPGFFNSKVVGVRTDAVADWSRLVDTLRRFLHRTLSSNSVAESEKNHRLDICLNTIDVIFKPYDVSKTLYDILRNHSSQLPQMIERKNTLARWCTSQHKGIRLAARCVVASILQSSQNRDNRWVTLARDQLDIQSDILSNNLNIKFNDHSASLAIFIEITRQISHSRTWNEEVLLSLSRFDIRKTVHGLQNEFCALWNQMIQEARDQGYDREHPVQILRAIRHHYIALHEHGDTPTLFDASTPDAHPILFGIEAYPSCNVHRARHPIPTDLRPTQHDDPDNASPHSSRLATRLVPGTSGSTALRQAEGANTVPQPSSAEEYPLPHAQGLPPASLTTDLVHTPPEIVSVRDSSIRDSIQMVALDLIRLFSAEASQLLHPSPPSSPNRTADVVRQDPHPDPVSVTGISPTVTHPSSHSVQQRPENDMQQDLTAQYSASDITQISSTPHQIPQLNPNAGATLQTREASIRVPHTTAPDPLPLSTTMPTRHSAVILVVLPSPTDSVVIPPDRPLHAIARLPRPPGDREHG